MSNEYWLSDQQWVAIEPLIPLKRRGVKPGRNRQVISGVLHVLKFGCRWRDCPEVYGPHTTIYNRFNRWSIAGIWASMLHRLVTMEAADLQCIDSTTSKHTDAARAAREAPIPRPSDAAEADARPKSMRLPTVPDD